MFRCYSEKMTLTEVRRLQKDMYAFCAATMFWATWLVIQCTVWRSYIQYSSMDQIDVILLTLSFLLTGVTFKNALKASSRQHVLSVDRASLKWCSFYAVAMCIISCTLIAYAYMLHRGDFPSKNHNLNTVYFKPHKTGAFGPNYFNLTTNVTSFAYTLPRVLYWDGYLLGCAFWLLMMLTTVIFQHDYRVAGSRLLNALDFRVPAG